MHIVYIKRFINSMFQIPTTSRNIMLFHVFLFFFCVHISDFSIVLSLRIPELDYMNNKSLQKF